MDRVLTLHPDPRKSGVRIVRWKYDAVREAILEAVPREEPGLLFKELAGLVRLALDPDLLAELGSVPWYTVTVKLDLEARGELTRLKGSGSQRLVRAR